MILHYSLVFPVFWAGRNKQSLEFQGLQAVQLGGGGQRVKKKSCGGAMISVVEEVRKLTSFPWRSWGKKNVEKSAEDERLEHVQKWRFDGRSCSFPNG